MDEDYYRQLVENSSDWIWEVDENLVYTYASPKCFDLLGHTPEEMIGTTPMDHMPPDEQQRVGAIIAPVIEKREEFSRLENTNIHIDGHLVVLETSGVPVFDDDGAFRGYRGVDRDITQRKRTEGKLLDALAEGEKAQAELADKMKELDFQKFALDEHAIVSISDVQGRITYANDKFCNISGYAREELLGQNHRILNSHHHPKAFFTDLWKTISAGQVWRGNVKNVRKDGSFYWVDATIVPFLNENGKPFQYVAIRTDITERVEAEHRAEKANRAKSEFLSAMSHELRTPLNAILGFGQMLEYNPNEPLSAAQKDCVQHIMSGGKHLLDLINDILDLAKIEAKKVTLSLENISLSDVIDECLSLTTTQAEQRNITVTYTHSDCDAIYVHADFTRLKQILLNLMSNAVKYNRENGSVLIDCQDADNHRLRINITDSGEGLSAEQQAELFQPFHRLGAETSDIEGTGIGLVVCKELVELMNGEIGIISTPGEGSTFWIEIPTATGLPSTETILDPPDEGSLDTLPGVNGTMLYVEDNPANLRLMELVVSHVDGLKMLSADTAEQGLEMARAHDFDLIVLDINLPGMSGLELVKKLKVEPKLKTVPIIALSAAATRHDIRKGLKAGFRHYLTKPINVPHLVDVIREMLEG